MATITAPTQTSRPRPVAPPPSEGRARSKNVGETERWASLLGGGALALWGLSRGSLGGLGLALVGGTLAYRGATGHCDIYEALGVNTATPQHRGARTSIPAGHGCKVEQSILINRSPEELFRFWRNLENLPSIMSHLKSVHSTDGNRSRWVAQGPLGSPAEWDAEIITERPNELIGWRSLEGSVVDTAGSVHFKRILGDRGTEVRVVLKYDPPAGKAGAAIAWLTGQLPEHQIREDLRRFKRFMETGEIPTTKGQPSGRGRDAWEQTSYMVLEERLARGLGWFGIGLGLAEIVAPETLAELIGIHDHHALIRSQGLREIATGIGILQQPHAVGWLWGRVAGDALDLALLTAACTSPGAHRGRITTAAAAVSGVAFADLMCSLKLGRRFETTAGRQSH